MPVLLLPGEAHLAVPGAAGCAAAGHRSGRDRRRARVGPRGWEQSEPRPQTPPNLKIPSACPKARYELITGICKSKEQGRPFTAAMSEAKPGRLLGMLQAS